MSWNQKEVKEAIEKVGKMASTDVAFRKLCLTEPERAIKKATGKEVPTGYRVRLIENAPGVDSTFVLPDMIKAELSEDELDRVAGGRSTCGNDCGDQGACGTFCGDKG